MPPNTPNTPTESPDEQPRLKLQLREVLRSQQAVNLAEKKPEAEAEQDAVVLEESDIEYLDASDKPISLVPKSKNKAGAREVQSFAGLEARKVQSVTAWNDYTIVLLEGDSEIRIYDKFGKKVEDFRPLGYKPYIFDWEKAEALQGYEFIATWQYIHNNTSSQKRYFDMNDLPPVLKEWVKYIGEADRYNQCKRIANIVAYSAPESKVRTLPENYQSGVKCVDQLEVCVIENGKYVILYDHENRRCVVFKTQREEGIVEPPRNWSRVIDNWLNNQKRKYITTKWFYYLKSKKELNLERLTDEYEAKISDDKLEVVKNDDLQSKEPLFTDNIKGVKNNVCTDPKNPNVVYYCKSENPDYLIRLDTSGEPEKWVTQSMPFPAQYPEVSNLRFEPNGGFFYFYSTNGQLVVLAKDTLEEVNLEGLPPDLKLNFDPDGRIRTVDEDGFLVIYETNFTQIAQEVEKRRVTQMVKGMGTGFQFEKEAREREPQEQQRKNYDHLNELKDRYQGEAFPAIQDAEDLEEIQDLFNALQGSSQALLKQGLSQDEVEYITKDVEEALKEKEKEIATKAAEEILAKIRAKLQGALSINTIPEAREDLAEAEKLKPLVDDDMRKQISIVSEDLQRKAVELFKKEGAIVEREVDGLVARVRSDLDSFGSKVEFDDWQEFTLPQLMSRLGALAHDCPIEAGDTHKKILDARKLLKEIAREYEKKFTHEYAKIRTTAALRIDELIEAVEDDIDMFIKRIRERRFTKRSEAEQYIEKSEARKAMEKEIEGLKAKNPDAARELERSLKVKISNVLSEIERGAFTQVSETGQQMVLFGSAFFPKWEAQVKEKKERSVDLTFLVDEKTKGRGIKAPEIMGDVGLKIMTSREAIQLLRLYEGTGDENEWRYGSYTYKGQPIPASYLSQAEYRQLRKAYADWQHKHSEIKKQLEEKRNAIHAHYKTRPEESAGQEFEEWKKRYLELLEEYAKYYSENYVWLLRRIDKVKQMPETEFANGKGYVPEWQKHWVLDPETENYLESMAKMLKMQLDLQEGLLLLKGHAGTGKDVLVKMFCERVNRPYFSFDCSKWTTEFELSEDIVLESKNGASQTIKVPSVVLNAITTPGAVMYFNEFNAMPEIAQIFLHALMDEKRSLTLKTSSGQTIKADSSVLFAASMNPGYPGTFEPQFATRSRMVSMDIDYPALYSEKKESDANPNKTFNASEALRIARGVESLADYTYEANMERNPFLQMWDKYINGIENGAQELTETEKFDMDVILALVQFGYVLRKHFVLKFEKSRDARKALPVTQPFTLRETRRCAYFLSQMKPEVKATANPEQVAKDLIEQFFLSHIDKTEDREAIKTAMTSWTSSKRPAAA